MAPRIEIAAGGRPADRPEGPLSRVLIALAVALAWAMVATALGLPPVLTAALTAIAFAAAITALALTASTATRRDQPQRPHPASAKLAFLDYPGRR